MPRIWTVCALVTIVSAAPAYAQVRPTPGPVTSRRSDYHDAAQLEARIAALVEARRDLVTVEQLGVSGRGRPLRALRLGLDVEPDERRPGLLVLGNLAGDEAAAGEAVLSIAEFIVAAHEREPAVKALMRKRVVWLIPRPNPDATELLFSTPARAQRRTLSRRDDDGDGDLDEDPALDLDGDGLALTMRRASADGDYIPDAGEQGRPELLRLADRSKGERGRFVLHPEGLDGDGDGSVAEDGVGGVDLDRNFPIFWRPPHEVSGAGDYPLCEPESRALADFMLRHKNIALAIHVHSGALEALSSGHGDVPADDKKLFKALRRVAREAARSDREPLEAFATPGGARASGTFQDFAYHGLGVTAWPMRIWTQPPAIDGEEAVAMPKDELGRQRIWLGFFERVGVGHSPWRSFKHPSLGDVAIGGFEPFSRRTPPQSYLASAVAPVVRFALNAATLLPEIELGSVKVEPLAGSLYAVEIELRNAGFLPTQTLKAEAIGRAAPTVVKLDLGKAGRVVAGSARMLVRRLAGGASVKRRVVLRMEGDGQAELEVWSERAGRALRLVKIDKDL